MYLKSNFIYMQYSVPTLFSSVNLGEHKFPHLCFQKHTIAFGVVAILIFVTASILIPLTLHFHMGLLKLCPGTLKNSR